MQIDCLNPLSRHLERPWNVKYLVPLILGGEMCHNIQNLSSRAYILRCFCLINPESIVGEKWASVSRNWIINVLREKKWTLVDTHASHLASAMHLSDEQHFCLQLYWTPAPPSNSLTTFRVSRHVGISLSRFCHNYNYHGRQILNLLVVRKIHKRRNWSSSAAIVYLAEEIRALPRMDRKLVDKTMSKLSRTRASKFGIRGVIMQSNRKGCLIPCHS